MKRLLLVISFSLLFVACDQEVKDYNKEARSYINQKNYTEALNLLNEAIEIDDKNDITWNNLSVCYEAIGEYELALEAARNAINYGEKKAAEYANLGNAYYDLGFKEEARIAYEQGLDLDRSHFFSNYGLGVYYSKKGAYQEGQVYFMYLFDNYPLNVNVVEYIAYNKYKMGQVDAAIVFLEEATQMVNAPTLEQLLETLKGQE